MEHDYNLLIENLKGRRYDEALREPILSDGFENSRLPDCVRYALEAMVEIDVSYAYKVYNNSRRIHEKINKELMRRGINVEYRYQGALKTFTNVLLYGDVEIIVIKKNPSLKPHKDIQALGMELMDILSGDPMFKSVDYSDKTRIRIIALKPTCEIDILPSVWVDTPDFNRTKNEIYRGITEFDFVNRKVKKYLPFLNIARFNATDQRLGGNLKALSRLLCTLQKDATDEIKLRHTEINSLLYAIPEEELKVDRPYILTLLPKVENHLERLVNDDLFFKELVSPSGKERVFASRPEKKKEIAKLHEMLKALLLDVNEKLGEDGLHIDSKIIFWDSQLANS